MADPKGLVYQGKEGTGFAQIFQGGPDAYEATREPLRNMIELKYQQLKEQKQKQAEQKAALAKLAEYTPYLDQNKQELEAQYEKIRDLYVNAAAQGLSPDDPTTEAGKEIIREKSEFNRLSALDKKMFDEWGTQQQILAQGKHDATQFAETWGKILESPTIQGRFDALRGSTPLVLNIDPLEGIDEYIPESIPIETRLGAGTQTITAAPPESIESNAKLFVLRFPEKVQYLIDRGVVEDPEGAVEYYKEKIEERTERGTAIERGPDGGGGVSVSVGGDGARGEKFVATYSRDPKTSSVPEGFFNNIQFGDPKTGLELPPIEMGGSYVKVADIEYRDMSNFKEQEKQAANAEIKRLDEEIKRLRASAASDNMVTDSEKKRIRESENQITAARKRLSDANRMPAGNKWVIVGTKAKRLTGEQIESEKKRLQSEFDSIYQQQEDGSYVSIREQEPVYLPISARQGEEGHANFSKFLTQTGIDLTEPLTQQIPSSAPTKPSQTTTKTTTKVISADEYRKVPLAERSKYKRNADGTYSLK